MCYNTHMIRIMKESAESYFRLEELNIGAFAEMKGKGMKFHTGVYDAEGAGRLCLMEMKGPAGLMHMDTGVFSPTEKDGPIFSFDYIKAAGKETLILELYDTTISHPAFADLEEVKERYAHLSPHDPGEHWYDGLRLPVSDFKGGRKITDDINSMLRDYSDMYFTLLQECAPCDPVEKKKCNAAFADGLLANGGPAVDAFRKMMGDERTEVFLSNYMFCCR